MGRWAVWRSAGQGGAGRPCAACAVCAKCLSVRPLSVWRVSVSITRTSLSATYDFRKMTSSITHTFSDTYFFNISAHANGERRGSGSI